MRVCLGVLKGSKFALNLCYNTGLVDVVERVGDASDSSLINLTDSSC